LDRIALGAYRGSVHEMAARLRLANGFLVGSGTYWNSWGSPLQRFFEVMTPYEATDVFAFKPASVVVTMDATGGAEVAARLSATFTCFGCTVPPFGWMALSRVAAALEARSPEATRDVWGPGDLQVLGANLLVAMNHAALAPSGAYRAWPVEAAAVTAGAWTAFEALPGAAPDFLE
jgi:chromate reductase